VPGWATTQWRPYVWASLWVAPPLSGGVGLCRDGPPRSGGSTNKREENGVGDINTLVFTRRNLPHWLVAEKAYFVTIRVQGSVPAAVLAQMRAEREALDEADARMRFRLQRIHFLRIEQLLDASGSQYRPLDHAEVAEMVLGNLSWLAGRGWRTYAATVLSTHMHVLVRNMSGRSGELLKDLAHFKHYTAQRANRMLGRCGHFWAREDFDHWIRSPSRFESVVRYIADNPVKAQRVSRWDEWPWTYVDDAVRYFLA
jgi:putative transposase